MHSECFRKEVLHLDNSLFENTVDACYLLTMEKSTRRNAYMNQLFKYPPYSKVQIIHNKGFRNCQKEDWITTPLLDIIDFYGKIFEECIHNNTKRVLILEDDFFFVDPIQTIRDYIHDIDTFLEKNNDFLIYNLGALPYFMAPTSTDMTHYYYKGGASHAVIYSQKAMRLYVDAYRSMTCSSDTFWNAYTRVFTFHKPFCFQLCPHTENSTYWCSWLDVNYYIRQCFKADKTHSYLFPFAYTASKFGIFAGFILFFSKDED